MRISSSPLVCVPPQLAATPAKPIAPDVTKHVVSGNASLPPVYRVNYGLVAAPNSKTDSEKGIEVIRAISNLVASQLGPKIKVANSAIWISLDAIKLSGVLRDPHASAGEKITETGHLAASIVDGVGTYVGSDAIGNAAIAIHFVMDAGEAVSAGKIDLTQADIATELGIEGAEVMKISELLST